MTRMERRRMREQKRNRRIMIIALTIVYLFSICFAFDCGMSHAAALAPKLIAPVTVEKIDPIRVSPVLIPVVTKPPIEPIESVVEAKNHAARMYSDEDVVALAQMAWGEALVTQSDMEMAACMWVALNRYDCGDPYYASCETIVDIVAQPGAFHGYSPKNPIDSHLVNLATDVLERWQAEYNGVVDSGRVLPKDYLFFHGDGRENHFRISYEHTGNYWDWGLPNPYNT